MLSSVLHIVGSTERLVTPASLRGAAVPLPNCQGELAMDTNHDAIVDDWRQNAEQHDEENYEFLRSMKVRRYGFDPDKRSRELHAEVFQIVDCTRCANCCKTLKVRLDEEDVQRIAGHLGLPVDEFTKTYLVADDEDGPYTVRQQPCLFLGADNRCTIYDVRPTVCRTYPHTDQKGRVFRTMSIANNALVCPAVYWIVEQMKRQALD
jgi:uncharacterized protein